MQFILEFQADHLVSALAAARHEIEHPAELLASIGESLYRVNSERHDKGLDPDGQAWPALAPSTLADGKRKGGPLKKTGRMLQSFKYDVAGDVLKLGFDGARDGRLADIHHGGTGPYTITAKKAKALKIGGLFRKRVRHPGLPSRRLVGFPAGDQHLVAEVTGDYLAAVLNRVR